MGLENEGKTPSFDVLYALVRELNLPIEVIFYPENTIEASQLTTLTQLLIQCSETEILAITRLTETLVSAKRGMIPPAQLESDGAGFLAES